MAYLSKYRNCILLFVIGLEFKLKDIAKIKYGVIAFTGILVCHTVNFSLPAVPGEVA